MHGKHILAKYIGLFELTSPHTWQVNSWHNIIITGIFSSELRLFLACGKEESKLKKNNKIN